MRLLKVNADGTFSLKTFLATQIPSYAILSHTWEWDNSQEVSFQDLSNGIGSSKAGYTKIQFCGEQARKDGLQYCWIDTCCIDKTNNTELTEAINSMFRWYQNAAKCYVYLSDVSNHDVDLTTLSSASPRNNSAFKASRWFTRGWTLQELLAPRIVCFYTKDGVHIGDKQSLEVDIHEITSIAISALRGDQLSHFSVDERFSWAEHRQTSIEEDKVYCLLGIFNIHLPLIYGESKENALIRLKEEIDKRAGIKTLHRGTLATVSPNPSR